MKTQTTIKLPVSFDDFDAALAARGYRRTQVLPRLVCYDIATWQRNRADSQENVGAYTIRWAYEATLRRLGTITLRSADNQTVATINAHKDTLAQIQELCDQITIECTAMHKYDDRRSGYPYDERMRIANEYLEAKRLGLVKSVDGWASRYGITAKTLRRYVKEFERTRKMVI